MSQQTYQGGALYELVARGVKDTYFFEDGADGVNPFSWSYEKYPAVQTETRHVRPLNASSFNRTIIIDIDQYGDILQSASIHVRLPSWIPPQYRPYIKRGVIRADVSGQPAYGYTSGPAYALFSKIEILQDNITLQELTGDALYVASRHEGSWNRHHYADSIAGVRGGADASAGAVQRSADPDTTYIIPLPFIADFPLVALRGQRFRVRLTLRDIKDIVVCTDPTVGRPAPWSVPQFRVWTSPTDISGTAFKPLGLAELDAPTVSIQLVQAYLSNEDRAALSKATYVIPYRRYITHNSYSVGPLTYSTYDATPPTEPAIIRNYDGLYYVDRVYTVVRSERALQQGRRTAYNNLTVSGEQYITSLQSAYGSTVRDGPWSELVWNRLAQHAHESYASAVAAYIQNYGFGPTTLKSDATHTSYNAPGGLNYSEAIDPNMRLTLADIEPDMNGVKGARVDIILCATAFYAVEAGRGGLLFGT